MSLINPKAIIPDPLRIVYADPDKSEHQIIKDILTINFESCEILNVSTLKEISNIEDEKGHGEYYNLIIFDEAILTPHILNDTTYFNHIIYHLGLIKSILYTKNLTLNNIYSAKGFLNGFVVKKECKELLVWAIKEIAKCKMNYFEPVATQEIENDIY